MTYRDDYRRLLRAGGFAIWAAVGIPVIVLHSFRPIRHPLLSLAWVGALLVYAGAFWRATAARNRGGSSRSAALALPAIEAIAVLALMALPPCFGLEGALLVVVALQLGALLHRRAAVTWISLQSAALLAVMWAHWDWHWGLVLAFAYVPFQLIADSTTRLLAEETASRERLASANAELEATRELLAQSTRMAERMRIGRELHDVLGHHLTALSLNLEIASHRAEGEARDRVATAQSLTKLLLGDVRAVVGALRSEEGLDLRAALGKLAEGIPHPRVHLGIGPDFAIDDPGAAEVVLRCAQEIVTNAVRHAEAENVWLDIDSSSTVIEIRARDDGRGAAAVQSGNGLSGMRERLEQRGGALAFETAPGRGFSVAATLPVVGPAP